MTRKPGAPLGFFLTSAQSLNIKAMSAKTSKIHADLEDYLERLASAVERAVDGINANKSGEDWQAKYLVLQEQYSALSALYQSLVETPPITDKNNEYLIPFDTKPTPEEAASNGLVQIKDLFAVAREANTSDLFEVLRVYADKTSGNLKDYVNAMEVVFNAKATKNIVTYLALTDNLTELDLIRITRSFIDGGFVVDTRTNKAPTYKELYAIAEQVFNIDLSNAATSFSDAIKKNCSEKAHKAIFDTMGQALVNKSVKTKYK